jgi:hypothetical protein
MDLSSSPDDVVAEKEDSPSVKDRSVKWILKCDNPCCEEVLITS